jgi:hypothetical protein
MKRGMRLSQDFRAAGAFVIIFKVQRAGVRTIECID